MGNINSTQAKNSRLKAIRIAEIRTKLWHCNTYKDALNLLIENTDGDKSLGLIEKAALSASLDQIFTLLKLKTTND